MIRGDFHDSRIMAAVLFPVRSPEAGLFKEKYKRRLGLGCGNLWVDARYCR